MRRVRWLRRHRHERSQPRPAPLTGWRTPLRRTRPCRTTATPATDTDTQDHIDITRNGEPAAVLVSYGELTALRETIAIMSDPGAVHDIRQAEADIAAGNTVSADQLREAMVARRPATA